MNRLGSVRTLSRKIVVYRLNILFKFGFVQRGLFDKTFEITLYVTEFRCKQKAIILLKTRNNSTTVNTVCGFFTTLHDFNRVIFL